MRIEFNKVTWYSKLAAVVVFILTFLIAFDLGMQYGMIKAQYAGWEAGNPADTQQNGPEGGLSSPGAFDADGSVGKQLPPIPVADVTFACDAGKSIHAQFFSDPDDVALTLSDGRAMTLPHALSADGARYANADESFVFWNKGNTAFVQEEIARKQATTFANCVESN